MDPNVTYAEITYLVNMINLGQVDPTWRVEYRENLSDSIEALAGWLGKGGFAPHNLPATWERDAREALATLN